MNTLKKLHRPNAIARTAGTYLAVIAAIAVVAVTTSTPLGSARAAGGLKDKHSAHLAELYELQAAFHAAASHGGDIDAMMQLWAGAIRAYYIFDLSRIGLVEVTPHRIHPQLINAFETAVAAAVTGAVIAALLLLTTKLEQRRISQAR